MEKGKIHSIPTTYKGTRFRSRLEAKWAAFFDLCGWEWTYEPFEYPGWIPDFLLQGDVLVEVKPYSRKEEFVSLTKEIEDSLSQVGEDSREVIICGCNGPCVMEGVETIGLLGELSSPDGFWWDWSDFGICWESKKWDFCHCIGHYQGRVHGGYSGSCPKSMTREAKLMWAKAGNSTQWNPR